MKKKDLISKWLDFNLDDSELEAFNKLDASGSYHKISETAKLFKSPSLDSDNSYKLLQEKLKHHRKTRPLWRSISAIAAILVISLGVLYFLNSSSTSHHAQNGITTQLLLPDSSEVILNAGSLLTYDADNWPEKRALSLKGEAYFKVAGGSTFTVSTARGTIRVIGTQFKVKDRPEFFEVVCYEGRVEVVLNNEKQLLAAGQSFKSLGSEIFAESTRAEYPEWLDKKTIFKSVPFHQVVSELERQYDIKITGTPVENTTAFTGTFSHENLETALQAITIPLNLSYSINGKNVVLKNNRQ